jgi:hypothetical protein
MDVPFEVDGRGYELGEKWATLSAENLRQERIRSHDESDAEAAVAVADKIEHYLVGNVSAPIAVTIDEGLRMTKNLDAMLVGAIQTKDTIAETQIRALFEALDARLKRHLGERHGPHDAP